MSCPLRRVARLPARPPTKPAGTKRGRAIAPGSLLSERWRARPAGAMTFAAARRSAAAPLDAIAATSRSNFALDDGYTGEREGTRVSKGGGHVEQIYTATLASTAAMWHMRSTTRFE